MEEEAAVTEARDIGVHQPNPHDMTSASSSNRSDRRVGETQSRANKGAERESR